LLISVSSKVFLPFEATAKLHNYKATDAVCMGEVSKAYRTLMENLKEGDNFVDLDVDGRIILHYIIRILI
jgi:hypothetical protein